MVSTEVHLHSSSKIHSTIRPFLKSCPPPKHKMAAASSTGAAPPPEPLGLREASQAQTPATIASIVMPSQDPKEADVSSQSPLDEPIHSRSIFRVTTVMVTLFVSSHDPRLKPSNTFSVYLIPLCTQHNDYCHCDTDHLLRSWICCWLFMDWRFICHCRHRRRVHLGETVRHLGPQTISVTHCGPLLCQFYCLCALQ